MIFNEDKVTKLFSEILQALQLLEDLKKLSLDAFLVEPHKIASAKYNLIVAIEGVIDLCNHIIAKNNFRAPEDYADTFKVMAEKGLISEEFAFSLIKMARFRNRLVHIYWDVESTEIYTILQNYLADIYTFLDIFKNIINGIK